MDEEATWRTRDGRVVAIVDMTDRHLINTIRYLERHEDALRDAEAFRIDCFADSLIGDMAQFSTEQASASLYYGENTDMRQWYPKYGTMIDEAERRKLEIA